MQKEDERPPNEKSHAYHFRITNRDVMLAYWPLLQFLLSTNANLRMASVNSWFHFPKILISSLQLKLFDVAQR